MSRKVKPHSVLTLKTIAAQFTSRRRESYKQKPNELRSHKMVPHVDRT